MSNIPSSSPHDGVQIMLGEYDLYQDELIGSLYVEELSGPAHTREHWILHRSYRWPSREYPRQQIAFKYRAEPGSLSDFLKGAPAGSTYVVADCARRPLPGSVAAA